LTDKITVTAIPLLCRLGVPAEERATAQQIAVTIELRMDLSAAGHSDSLAHTVDYAEVRAVLEQVAGRREYLLVESLAEEMAREVLARFPVPEVLVAVSKPQALAAFGVGNTTIEIVRPHAIHGN
jgi:7,8-dihydroneopterin aldolase/epimerase/oxygenase